jgi:hypothetical protein
MLEPLGLTVTLITDCAEMAFCSQSLSVES